jgi:CRISPR-associated protein Csd2
VVLSSSVAPLFWQAFQIMFEHDRASSRSGLSLRGIYVFTHDDAFGRAPSHLIFDLIHVKPLHEPTARSIEDYGPIEIDDAALPAGVTLTRLIG